MGNNWMVPLLVIGGIAVAGFLYLRSIGRLPELPCVSWLGCHGDPLPHGDIGPTPKPKGIAVGEFNPAIPKDTRPTKNGKPCGYGGFPPC